MLIKLRQPDYNTIGPSLLTFAVKAFLSSLFPSFTSFAYRRMPKSPEVLFFIKIGRRSQIKRQFWPICSHLLHKDFHTLTLSHFPSFTQTDRKTVLTLLQPLSSQTLMLKNWRFKYHVSSLFGQNSRKMSLTLVCYIFAFLCEKIPMTIMRKNIGHILCCCIIVFMLTDVECTPHNSILINTPTEWVLHY